VFHPRYNVRPFLRHRRQKPREKRQKPRKVRRAGDAEAQTREAEAEARVAEAQRNWVGSRHQHTTAWLEARMKDRAHRFEQACQSSETERLEVQLGLEAKIYNTAPQKEAMANSTVVDTMICDADAQTRDATVQTMEADNQCKEEGLCHRGNEAFHLEERA